jgi:hypothetical protein
MTTKMSDKSRINTKLAVLCVCIGFTVSRATAAGTPRIQFDKTVYDFGVTSGVQSVTGTFTFSNTGDGELKVDAPKPSCGCTVASVKPDTLKPGEQGELVFTLNMYNLGGHIEKTIGVPSNDPINTNLVLTVQVENKLKYVLTPAFVALGDVHPGATTNAVIEVKRTDGGKLAINRTEAGGAVDVQVQSVDDQTARLNLKVLAFGSPRRISEVLRVYGEDGSSPIGTVMIYGRIVGDLVVSPEAVFWGITNPGNWAANAAAEARRVAVTSTKPDQALEISNLSWDVPEMKVELVPVEKGKSYTIIASLPQPPKESVHGSISFNTNLPSQPQVVVPVTINVSQ